MLAVYDCGDHLHPSDAGYNHMGDMIDLGLFERGPFRPRPRLETPPVIARSAATKQSPAPEAPDCFVAALLAMTVGLT